MPEAQTDKNADQNANVQIYRHVLPAYLRTESPTLQSAIVGPEAPMKYNSASLLLVIDLLGTFVFALGGGIIRDLLIGATSPGAIRDWRYGAVAFLGSAVVFFWHQFVSQIPGSVLVILDAAGLGLFAVAGAAKALEFGVHPFLAVLMGGITGVGGGTIRDILLAQIPGVLRVDVYATAALLGAAVTVVGLKLSLPPALMSISGITVCFLLRVVSVWRHW